MSRRNGLRDRWLPHVLNGHTGAGYGCRLMLTVMHSRMTDKGYVSIPRTELAGILGVHPSRVTAWTKEAIAAGLLQKVGGGYHGRTAEFAAVIPTPKVSANKSPSVGKVPVFESPKTSHLSAVQTGHEGERKQVTQYARVTYETRQSNGRARDAGVEPDHADTEEQELREGENPPTTRRAATSPRARG